MQNFVPIGSGVSTTQIRDFAVPFDVTIVSSFYGFFIKATPYTFQADFLRKICQKTLFQVSKCVLGSR